MQITKKKSKSISIFEIFEQLEGSPYKFEFIPFTSSQISKTEIRLKKFLAWMPNLKKFNKLECYYFTLTTKNLYRYSVE